MDVLVASLGTSCYYLPPPRTDPWFTDYKGEDILVLDDTFHHFQYMTLVHLLSGHPNTQLEFKNGTTIAKFTRVIICSVKHPRQVYSHAYDTQLDRRLDVVFNYKGSYKAGTARRYQEVPEIQQNLVLATGGGALMASSPQPASPMNTISDFVMPSPDGYCSD